MHRFTLAAALIVGLLAPAGSLRAENYKLDEGHTSVVFGISHMGFSITYGRFNKVSGSYALEADPAASSFKLAIDAASVDTNNPKRDEHLRGADFFSTGEFPAITFESTGVNVSQEGDKTVYNVTGQLTMHGVTKDVTLPLVKLGEGDGPDGAYHTGFACETTLKRSDFGMNKYLPGLGDDVRIMISFEGVRE